MVKGRKIEERLIRANPVSRPEHLHEDPAESAALLALILERRDEMTTTKKPATKPGRTPRWRPALVASATAFLVLMVIGVAALIGFTGGESDSAGTPLPRTAGLLEGSWEHMTSPAPFDWDGVVETRLGLFATSSNDGIIMSEDGSAWRLALALPRGELIEGSDSPGGGGDDTTTTTAPPGYTTQSHVGSVVEFDNAVYAFAVIAEDVDTPAMTTRRIAYRSTDGAEWVGTTYSTESDAELVVAGENEMLVVSGLNEGRQQTILRSEDGVNWIRHEPGLNIESIGFVGDRYLAVTVNEDADGYEWGKRSMIESVDGIEWQPIPGSDLPYNAFPNDPTLFEGRIYMGGLVFGEDTWQHGTVFVSDDGSAWSQAVVPDIPELRFVTRLIPTEHGLLALGSALWSEDPEMVDRMVPMTTTDGTTFVEVPHAAGLFDGAPEGHGHTMGDQVVVSALDHETRTFHQWVWTPAD